MKRTIQLAALSLNTLLLAACGSNSGPAATTVEHDLRLLGGAATYDITTLAGKVASVRGTAGLQIRMSALIEHESGEDDDDEGLTGLPPGAPIALTPITSALDATTLGAGLVSANQDTGGLQQNETTVAVDPNNPNIIVGGANDFVTGGWSCTFAGQPCGALADAYSGAYLSLDGGKTWSAPPTDPTHLSTMIPGVTHLTGGPYDAGGDPSIAFDSQGAVYYAGLGFNRETPANTLTVHRGNVSGGVLRWAAPTFVAATTSPAILNDKEWIAVDAHPHSPYRDRIYLSWTRFIFNAENGQFTQSPIFFASSSDRGRTFSEPKSVVANVLYGQGSRVLVGPDGAVYVFWEGTTRLAQLNSIYMVKSVDGGATFSKPAPVSTMQDVTAIADTVFRVNSFPSADVAPNGDLYVAWTSQMNDVGGVCVTMTLNGCHATAMYARSSDGGRSWSAATPVLPALDTRTRAPIGYPLNGLYPPAARRVDTFWPQVAISPNGRVHMTAYAADVVSPWQSCTTFTPGASFSCNTPGVTIHNARLDQWLVNVTSGSIRKLTNSPINTRYQFRGSFIGDYTGLAVGADDRYHALWTDTNNVQQVSWWYGTQFTPTPVHQQDAVSATGTLN
ncbi:sialidase family protein [Deinococcus pimensis]|uniref:sialidase family protein n=1 Tax=Deinococcus pimensis TaxID=309888 RepID=UPI0004810A65|nr:sialidase family protein [Deinococcus pimensis]